MAPTFAQVRHCAFYCCRAATWRDFIKRFKSWQSHSGANLYGDGRIARRLERSCESYRQRARQARLVALVVKHIHDLKILRYNLYLVDVDPTQSSGIAKTRRAIVVSPDAMNKRIDTVIVCPLTSQLHPTWASRVQCECAGRPNEIAVDQIRTVSKSRLQKHIGKIDLATANQLRGAIALLYATA